MFANFAIIGKFAADVPFLRNICHEAVSVAVHIASLPVLCKSVVPSSFFFLGNNDDS